MKLRASILALGVLCASMRPLGAAAGPSDAPPEAGQPVCGNGRREPPETCDDGNTLDGDDCPSNCRIERCTPTSERFDVSVKLEHRRDGPVAGVIVLLDYPEGAVMLPGAIGERTVVDRISHVPKDFASVPYDLDYALKEAVVLNRPLPPGELFQVSFDRCDGVPAPRADAFTCRVEQASSPDGKMLPRDQLACSVRIP